MKKPLLLCVLALTLASCSFVPNKKGDWHHGISLLLQCHDDLQIATADTHIFMDNLDMTGIEVGTSTIKRYDGNITFYGQPIFGEAQLNEVPNDQENRMYYFETEVEFLNPDGKEVDFVYFTGIEWKAEDNENIVNENLRLAVFDKHTNTDCFVFSQDPEGITSPTEYPLDLNGDGLNDRNENGEILYTTGFPYYVTDSYSFSKPMQRDIEQDHFDPFYQRMKVNDGKTLTIRMWVEGWLLSNESIQETNVNIKLDFAPHYVK